MRLVSSNCGSNAHFAAKCANNLGLARFVVNINDSGVTVFRAANYSEYLLLCEKLRQDPVSEKEFHK